MLRMASLNLPANVTFSTNSECQSFALAAKAELWHSTAQAEIFVAERMNWCIQLKKTIAPDSGNGVTRSVKKQKK
jgi:hypothetical protein